MQNNVELPEGISFDFPAVEKSDADGYNVYFKSGKDIYKISTSDFLAYRKPEKSSSTAYPDGYKTVNVSGINRVGVFVPIDKNTFAKLKEKIASNKRNNFIVSMTPEKIKSFLEDKHLKATLSADVISTKK